MRKACRPILAGQTCGVPSIKSERFLPAAGRARQRNQATGRERLINRSQTVRRIRRSGNRQFGQTRPVLYVFVGTRCLTPFGANIGRIQSLYSNAGPGRLLEGRAVPVPNAGSIQISDPERGPCRGEIAGQGRFVAAGSVRVAGDDCAAVTNVVGGTACARPITRTRSGRTWASGRVAIS